MSPQSTAPPRLPREAILVAAVYVGISALYIWASDRLLAATFGHDPARMAQVGTLKGWVFVFATGVALFLLTWRLKVAWRRSSEADAARRRHEQHELVLFEHGPDCGFLLNGSVFVAANRVAGGLFRCAPEALVGKTLWQVSPPVQPDGTPSDEASRAHLGAVREGEVHRFPWRHRGADGVDFDTEVSLSKVPGPEGAVLAWVRDVTDRQRIARIQSATYRISEATASAEDLPTLFGAIHGIVAELMHARNFYIALYDPATDVLSFPYDVDEVDLPSPPRKAGRGLTEYVLRTGEPLLATPAVFEDLVRRGQVDSVGAPSIDWLGVPLKTAERTTGVLAIQTYSEGVRYGETEKAILMFVSAQVAMAIQRKTAETALHESETRYRRLVEASPEGIGVHREGRFVFANPTLAKIFGAKSPAEVVGRPVLDFVHPEFRDQVRRRAGAVENQAAEAPLLEEKLLRLDGTVIDAEIVGIPFSFGGQPAVQVVVRDVTGRREIEEHLRQAQKMEAIGSLAGGIAHDFNNLLQAMLGTVQAMRSGDLTPEGVGKTVGELEAHVRRGAALARQLLIFARREITNIDRLDLNAVMREAADLLVRLLHANIRMSVEPAPEPVWVDADRGQLEQVLVNLVTNAADAMPDGGRLSIRCGRQRNSEAWFEVEDNGVGVPDAVRGRIFEPFFTTKGAGKGTGLGLAVVHGIVTQHGGRVELMSHDAGGTVFRVILPYRPGGAPISVGEGSAKRTSHPGRGERVLLVEDEPRTRESLREALAVLGYHCLALESGELAENLPGDAPFDVLLTDLVLPGIHGGELARRLAAKWPGIRVIVMSGYTEDEAIRRGVREGNVRFLQKPFDMDALAAELRLALDGSP